MESADVGLIVIDEPAPEPIWKTLKSRRRMGCVTLMPMTPLDVEPYILSEIKTRVGSKGYYHIEASVYDACRERGIRGHLDPKIIDEMVASYSEDERESRVYGRFMYFSERIYGNLERSKHFRDPDEFPIDFAVDKVLHVVDPADGRETASIWMAVKPNGRRIVFTEAPVYDMRLFWEIKRVTGTVYDDVEGWYRIEDSYPEMSPYRRIIDKVFGFQRRGGRTIAKIYMDCGRELSDRLAEDGRRLKKAFIFSPSYRSNSDKGEIAYGHDIVREMLEPMSDGEPGLIIWNTCHHTWNGMFSYVRKRARGVTDSYKAAGSTKIVEKFKDFPDCVRYGCCEPVSFDNTSADQNKSSSEKNNLTSSGNEKNIASKIAGMLS
jgi:hypothetical protein